MSKEPTLWDKRKQDRDTFQKGVREGWDQALWLIIALAVGIAILA